LYCGSEPNNEIQEAQDDSLTVSPQASFSPRKIGVLAAPQAGYESPRFAETWRIVVGEANLDIEKGIST
jgi:hypothetical protein